MNSLPPREGPDEARDAMIAFIRDPLFRSPAERYAAKAKTFPEPDFMNAFSFRGRMLTDGEDWGTVTLKASGAEIDGRAVWIVSERVVFQRRDTRGATTPTATLDAALRPVSGRMKLTTTGKPTREVEWRAEGDGWRIEGEEALLLEAGPVTSTITALCLVARFVLPETGDLALASLRPDGTPDGSRFERFDLVLNRESE